MTKLYCCDTHPLVWYFLGKKTLSKKAKVLIGQGLAGKLTLVIPTIAVLEVFHISLKDPRFVFPDFLKFLKEANAAIVPFDKRVLNACYKFPREINIHDRVIAATSAVYNCPIITRDEILAKHIGNRAVW